MIEEKPLSKKKMYFCEDDYCHENAMVFTYHKKIIVYPEKDVAEAVKKLKEEICVARRDDKFIDKIMGSFDKSYKGIKNQNKKNDER